MQSEIGHFVGSSFWYNEAIYVILINEGSVSNGISIAEFKPST
jgi:hypothetical protein